VAAVRHLDADTDVPQQARAAAVAHLSRYRDASREHTEPDLRLFFDWCRERSLAPLSAQRNDLELYARWMQEVRRLKPSTVSRRMSVAACFYRTCVIVSVVK
jgi:site-specific recombinase XerD